MPIDRDTLVRITGLKTWFYSGKDPARAVDGIDLEIKRGETFALLGESGCGKSMSALSIMRLVPEPAGKIVGGNVFLGNTDLLQIPEVQMRNIRGRRIAMIFQEPMTSLNPVLTIGRQVEETVVCHGRLKGRQSPRLRVLDLLDAVGIPDPPMRYAEYPHQLSGGMKQRIMIAIALAGEPDLLIADEPTTALDVTIQLQVLELLRDLQRRNDMSILLITHDLGVVAKMADHVAVMYAGQIVEQADCDGFFSAPKHPYSQKLFDSLPTMAKRGQRLAVIPGFVPSLTTDFTGCRFEPRCDKAMDICRHGRPQWQDTADRNGVRCFLYGDANKTIKLSSKDLSRQAPQKTVETCAPEENIAQPDEGLLKVKALKVHFPIYKGVLKRIVGYVRAVDDISLTINRGRTLALVGESGCGKTTVGKGILQLIKPTQGDVLLKDRDLTKMDKRALRRQRGDIQIIFQDPFSSMNPRMMVVDIIEEGMIAQRKGGNAASRQTRIDELLAQVGLSSEIKHRYPHEFSGGQRQRICIARALAVEPKIIVCDEPTSALDVSVQAQILNLLKELQDRLGLAYLFITHDLSVVEYLAHEIAVMYLGRIVERGPVQEIIEDPQHPYTQALLSAVPTIDAEDTREIIRLRGELPSPANPPVGCHFHPRCTQAIEKCSEQYPALLSVNPLHEVSCILCSDNR